MIDHTLIDPAIGSWLDGMGLQNYMRDKTEPNVRMQSEDPTKIVQAIGSYKFLASLNPGWDELRQDVSADPKLLDQVITGHRVLTISVQVRSIRADAPDHAFALAERARTRLRLPSVTAIFKAAGIAFADTTDVVDISFPDRNQRTNGLASFDFRVNAAAAESDPVTDTIGTVLLSTNYLDETGTPLPAANQLSDHPVLIDP